jgi:hypothetical protein
MGEWIHILLNSAVVGGEQSVFAPRPPYPGKKRPRFSLDKRLGGPQNRSGRRRGEKVLDPTGTQL